MSRARVDSAVLEDETYIRSLVAEAQAGSEKAKTELVRLFRPLVVSLVHKTNYTEDQRSEQESAGWVGLFEAVERFDPAHEGGKDFHRVAWYRIRHHITEWCARNSGSLPMTRWGWGKGTRIDDALRQYAEENPGEPNPAETLSDKDLDALTGVSGSRAILNARRGHWPVQLDEDAPPTASAEDEYFDGADDSVERSTLRFVESLDELDPEDWYTAALSFCADQGLPEVYAERIVSAKAEGF